VATVQKECKVEIDVDEYADTFKPFLMDAVYAWSKVRKYSHLLLTFVHQVFFHRSTRELTPPTEKWRTKSRMQLRMDAV
jgi:ATP-dependent RNA helicase DOB1